MSMHRSNLRELDLDRLIAGLYEAAMQPDLWENWISSAAKCFGSGSGLSVVQDVRNGAVELLSAHNVSADALRLYGEYYHQCDLWTQRSGRTLMKATLSADLCTDEEFANSEIYVDFSKPHADDQFYVVGAVVPVGQEIGVIGFQNPRRRGAFSRLHATALDRLLPHLQRALTIRAKLREAEGRDAASEAVLDSLSHGILLVTLGGALVHTNRVAEEILRQADGLAIGVKGGLVAAGSADTSELRRMIASCAFAVGGGGMRLARPSGLRPLEVIVAPLAGSARRVVPAKSAAIIFLRDPEVHSRPVPDLLVDLYRLTPAEARLATDLLTYRTLEEISAQRRLSRETLRTQLKELFRKTGTSRQSELIGFLTAGLAVGVQQRTRGS